MGNLTSSYMDFLHPGVNYCRLLGLYPILALCVLLLSTSPGSGHLDRGPLLSQCAKWARVAGSLVHMTPWLHCGVLHSVAAEGLLRVVWPWVDHWMLKVCVLRWTVVVRALLRYIVIL